MKKQLVYLLVALSFVGCAKQSLYDIAHSMGAKTLAPSIVSTTSSSITVKLDTDYTANAFQLLYNTVNATTGAKVAYMGSSTTPITVTGLLPNKQYWFYQNQRIAVTNDWNPWWGFTTGTTSSGTVSTKQKKVSVVGSSISAYGGSSTSWSAYAALALGSNYHFTNYAVGGSYADQISNQVGTVIANADTATYDEYCFIECGINDDNALYSASTTFNKVAAMVISLQSHGIKVIVSTVTAVQTSAVTTDLMQSEQIRQDYNALIRAGWQHILHANAFVDIALNIHLGIMLGYNSSDQVYFTSDNIHPNDNGHLVYSNMVVPAIQALVAGNTYGTETTAQPVSVSSLSIPGISPTFSTSTNYYTTSTSSTSIVVTATSPNTLTGTGTISLVDGANYLLVQANNGVNQKTYLTTVTKSAGAAFDVTFGQFAYCSQSGTTLTTSTSTNFSGATSTAQLMPGGYAKMQINSSMANSLGVTLVVDSIDNANYQWANSSLLACAYIYGGTVCAGRGSAISTFGGGTGSMWYKITRSLDGRTQIIYRSNDDVTYTAISTLTNICSATATNYVKIVFGGSTVGVTAINVKQYNP